MGQGTAFVYDVSDPASPTFLFVQHLTPASRLKNAGAAYADGSLGDVDPESSVFLTAAESPTGNAGVMFAGAWSGTISFYEFADCEEPEEVDISGGLEPSCRSPCTSMHDCLPRTKMTGIRGLAPWYEPL